MSSKIDFVVTWVDGSDPQWTAKKAKYDGSIQSNGQSMNSEKAYREWGTFKYWFRGVEKFAPWVNKIYLVTDQQKPNWLNLDNEKIVLVDHSEIINSAYLPVFSANPIESNIHRIPGLSETFVFFNDDMYLTAPVEPTDFFSEEGLPKYNTALAPITTERNGTGHFQMNDMGIITTHFSKKTIFRNGQFFSLKQGVKQVIKTMLYGTTKFICGFWESHMPYPLLKSTFELVWEKEREVLEATSSSKFRNPSDTNVWLFKYWQIASGKYSIGNSKIGILLSLSDASPKLWEFVKGQKYQIMCINDSIEISDEEKTMADFIDAMNSILPAKSQFEK